MVVIDFPKSEEYQSLYALSGYSSPTSLIVTNDTPSVIFLTQKPTKPEDDYTSFSVHPYQTILVHGDANPIWCRGKAGKIIVQKLSSTITPFTAIEFPHDTLTSDAEGYRRLRVDLGQTGFFEGREARSFKEFSIPSGQSYFIKASVVVNTILMLVDVSIDSGGLRVSTIAGGTETTPFNSNLPVLPKNLMTTRRQPYYTLQNQLQDGGTITDGTVIDIVRLVTAGSTAQQSTVGGTIADERGVATGTYYWRFENISNSTVNGVFHVTWEERP